MSTPPLYIPILKSKAGERWALSNLKNETRSVITPLIEFHKPPRRKKDAKTPPKTLAQHADAVCESLVDCWGTKRPLFLDTTLFGADDSEGVGAARTVFKAATKAGLSFIPVTGTERSSAYNTLIKRVVEEKVAGVMIRARHSDVNASYPAHLQFLLDELGVPMKKAALLLDYRSADLNLAVHLPRIPSHDTWKLLAVAGGSFPASLKDSERHTWIQIEREELVQFLSQTAHITPGKIPVFSDYTSRHNGPPAGGGNPPVSIRYTCSDHWLVRLDGSLQDGDAPQMVGICADLLKRKEFKGSNFSAGDEAITLCSTGESGTGGAPEWTKWGISHHLEYVTKQLKDAAA